MLATIPLTAEQHQRLAFIRHLLAKAVTEADTAFALRPACLLTLHDAVELFLALACEATGRALPPRTGFQQYFDLLRNGAPSVQLAGETGMHRLNTARV